MSVCEVDWAAAVDVCDELLGQMLGLPVEKALDPLKPRDFDIISARLGAKMANASAGQEKAVMDRALNELDVDWKNLSGAQIDRIFVAVDRILRTMPERVLPKVQAVVDAEAGTQVGRVRGAVRKRYNLDIGADFNSTDQRIVDHLRESQAMFVTDEFQQRRPRLSQQARDIVAEGILAGQGRTEIGDALEENFRNSSLGRSRAYYDVVAGVFTNRARTFGTMSSFQEAGITTYVFEAVMDRRTTDICRLMHGREFKVADGLDGLDQVAVAEDPVSVKDIQPWVRQGKDSRGREHLWVEKGGRRHRIANVDASGWGRMNRRGSYSSVASDKRLTDLNVIMPPLHGRCRSMLLAGGL